MKNCKNHENKAANFKCHSCEKYFCHDCVTQFNEKYFCSNPGCQFVLKIEQKKALNNPPSNSTANVSILVRLFNYVIDMMTLQLIIFEPLFKYFNYAPKLKQKFGLKDFYMVGLIYLIIFLYYLISEYFFNKSFAKIITKTKIVTINNEKPSFKTILIRSLTRFVPFEFITQKNGNWLHDRLSKTKVIKG